jgi:P27 family predicted phage terminase small subunit
MRGRPRKPTALKLIEGNPGKRKIEPDPDAGPVGDAPADLEGIALDKWHEMTRLWRLVATAADRDQLAEYCRLEARRVEAEEMVRLHGSVGQTAGGSPTRSAWLIVLDKCREDMRKIAVEFGGTPASRTRVKAAPEAPATKFGALIGVA